MSDKKPTAVHKAAILLPVQAWLSSTSAHGLSRLSGQRPIYIKLIWLLAFTSFMTIFVIQVQVFVKKYHEKPQTTTLQEDSVEFEFPDLVICSTNIVSGSYPYMQDSQQVSEINSYVNKTNELFGIPSHQHASRKFAQSLMATLPYRLLSDRLGHRADQLVMRTAINGMGREKVHFSTFYSPSELNCVRFEPTDEQRAALSIENNYLEIMLFLDGTFIKFSKTIDIAPVPLEKQSGFDFLTWDLIWGINLKGWSGVNLYFAKRGHYPSPDSVLQLSSGKEYTINLEMEKLTLSKGMQCLSDPEPMRIVSPYNGSETAYQYSQYLCRSERINELLMKHSGCVNHLLPRSKRFESALGCLNTNGPLFKSNYQRNKTFLNENDYFYESLDQRKIQRYCKNRRPCETWSYTFTYSSGTWPRIYSSNQVTSLWSILMTVNRGRLSNETHPGYVELESIVTEILDNMTSERSLMGSNYMQDQLMQIKVKAGKSFGPTVTIERSYELANLVSDAGGILGLYMGCSLLTVLEVLELLHDCLLGCCSVGTGAVAPRTGDDEEDKNDPAGRGTRVNADASGNTGCLNTTLVEPFG